MTRVLIQAGSQGAGQVSGQARDLTPNPIFPGVSRPQQGHGTPVCGEADRVCERAHAQRKGDGGAGKRAGVVAGAVVAVHRGVLGNRTHGRERREHSEHLLGVHARR